MGEKIEVLDLLIGKKLTDVIAVVDSYLSFQFEDLILDSLSMPIIKTNDETKNINMSNYKEMISLIVGQKVMACSAAEDALILLLSSKIELIIPLDSNYPIGPEMAVLSGHGRFYASWLRKQK